MKQSVWRAGVWLSVLSLASWGCGNEPEEAAEVQEMGMIVLPGPDLGQPADQGQHIDKGSTLDLGEPLPPDLGESPDKGLPNPDADNLDAGVPDADTPDKGDVDAGSPDAGAPDADAPDASESDAGAPDADMMSSGPAVCGNGVVEIGELCDGNCPTSCDDGDACTMDFLAGDPVMCNVVCTSQPSGAACGVDDGCCPSGCMPGQDPDCVAPPIDCRDPSTWPAAWEAEEQALLSAVNARRAMGGTCGMDTYPAGTAPLTLSTQLREAARCHTLDMATRDYFAGASPEGVTVGPRVTMTGYMFATVGQSLGTAADANTQLTQWLGNAGSCRHILDPKYDDLGVSFNEGMGSQYPRYRALVVGERR